MRYLALLTALFAAPALSQADPQSASQSDLQSDPGLSVSEVRLRADMGTIVGFGTRHTLSSQTDPERGIGAAVDWALAEFGRIGSACGKCLEVVPVSRMVEVDGRRIPEPTLVRNAVAIQRGSERPEEVIIVQAHYDTRVTDVMNAQADAPGANDDGSGSVMILEAARILSQREYPSTIIYALLSGEEQGLYGAEILADWVGEQGMTVKAVLNNDMIGNSCGSDGVCDAEHLRVFSEGPRADLTDQMRARQRYYGGENDSPSRNIGRWLGELAARHPDGMQVKQVWRTDRMGRGGDQIPFLDRGYPAVRLTVAVEDYEHQHQDLRVENGVTYGDTIDELDWDYLTRSSVLNVRALHALAMAPMPPRVTKDGVVRNDIGLMIEQSDGAARYDIWKRATNASEWEWRSSVSPMDLPEGERDGPIDVVLSPERGDDWFIGVSACSAQGYCSPVASAVPGGEFYPLEPAN